MSIFKFEISHFVAYDNKKQLKLCIQVTRVNDDLSLDVCTFCAKYIDHIANY